MAQLGMRRGEIAQVHARDLERDLAGWTLVVHGKGAKVRRVPLEDALAARVRRAAGGDGYAFPGAVHGHLSPAWVGRLVSRELPAQWTTHSLRHRFATVAYVRSDHDLEALRRQLGHASLNTTQRYVRVSDEALRRMVSLVAAV